ncbi:YbhB/YbcL family Raf kinase inhibitor-like protein [Thermoplasma sp. Kam2015]|uniref:YbhB/YbcL family Raf kinase inhibitor-like protein n=1 Tax=Thermoplasma sp. Kam2015 TaxID=2094122 RepID=UPI000D8D4717|nr:YbhB/YbcL family Raf kinase inhibitor-like protein [Thermoplasma sp. Kam2015]PYB67935.1 YbhB/YbcL family Raf kinase inhibitor-like protein [Thermoplasma sp. Kam2015]
MEIKVEDFSNGSQIPVKFTCDGSDEMPKITIEGVPDEAKALALIVDDPDAPSGLFTHCIIYNIPVKTKKIDGSILKSSGVFSGINDFGNKGYGGPCPPPGKPHRYYFKILALDRTLEKPGMKRREFDNAISGHVVATAEYMGTYLRKH